MIQSGNWQAAEAAIAEARRWFPEEASFVGFEEQVRRGRFEWGLQTVTAELKEKLAANRFVEAAGQLQETRKFYSGDPRWRSLQQEIDNRLAYESEVTEAAAQVRRGELGQTGPVGKYTPLSECGPQDGSPLCIRSLRKLAECQPPTK